MNKTRIAALLTSGLKPSQVATVVNCSPSRISQLLQEEDFKLLLQQAEAKTSEEDIEEASLSTKYNLAEHSLINSIMDSVQGAELRDLTQALRVVSDRQEKMKSRLKPMVTQESHGNINVVINLPSHAIPRRTLELTSNREVVAIEGRTLAPLSSDAVTNLFASMKGGLRNEPSPKNTESEESYSEAISLEAEESFLSYATS